MEILAPHKYEKEPLSYNLQNKQDLDTLRLCCKLHFRERKILP